MIIKSKNIFIYDGFYDASIEVKNELITSVVYDDSLLIDNDVVEYNDCFIVPGLIDIHTHGCNGYDFCEGSIKALDAISSYQLKSGITSFCPTTMTYSEDILAPIMRVASTYKNDFGSEIVGINMEGPFISREKLGAQNPKYIQKPNIDMLKRLQNSANGLIKLVDIAPELDNSIDFIKACHNDYVISIAHTNANYAQCVKAYDAGAKHLTHMFNAMSGIHHRLPGPIIAAFDKNASVELICDGLHIDYACIRLAFKIFDNNKLCLVSDSCEATGLGDGQYSLGGQNILKFGNKIVLKDKPDTIAASATNLFDCMKHAIFDANVDMSQAINAATLNPAKAIGIDNLYGSIEECKYADFIVLDRKFNIIDIFKRGKKVI